MIPLLGRSAYPLIENQFAMLSECAGALFTRKREEEEDWGKCPALIRSCVMLGQKIGRPKEQGGQGSEV
jgi:hypothetical protein